MLRYNSTTIGKITIKQNHGEECYKYDIQIRQGNCLAVFIYVRRSTPEELEKNPEGKYYHSLYTFFADEQHCKNLLKEYGTVIGDEVVKAELNMYYKECYTILKYFMKSDYKVKCYYKEPKNKD